MCPTQTIDDEGRVNPEGILFTSENSSCQMRVGSSLHSSVDFRPEWSPKFTFDQRSTSQQLVVRSRSQDRIYQIALDIRPGTQSLHRTKLIFINAKFSIINRTSTDLLLAQHSIFSPVEPMRLPSATTRSFHWPNFNAEQLLTVALDIDRPLWSRPFAIDSTQSFHLNVRSNQENASIVHLQILEEHGTFFVILFDTQHFPSPFVLVNRSSMPIDFAQQGFPHLRRTIRPNETIDYALEDPMKNSLLTCSTGDLAEEHQVDLMRVGPCSSFIYPPLKYFALEATFVDEASKQLVIDLQQNELIVAQRNPQRSSQLWFVSSHGHHVHFDSSKPFVDWKNENLTRTIVLDLHQDQLTLRPFDPQRSATQRWTFDHRGFLRLLNSTFVVQIFGEFDENSPLIVTSIEDLLPTTFIRSHEHFLGSRTVHTEVVAQGGQHRLEFRDDNNNDRSNTTLPSPSITNEIHLDFPSGITLSLVSADEQSSEELLYGLLKHVQVHLKLHDKENSLQTTVDDIQVCSFRSSSVDLERQFLI